MKKTVLILWGVGALFLISSIPLFVEGNISSFAAASFPEVPHGIADRGFRQIPEQRQP